MTTSPSPSREPAATDTPVDRRHLLRRAGTAAATAAAGGLVLGVADASPAAAATLSGSGNPGIAAAGIGGHGIDATTDTSQKAALHGSAEVNGAYALFARRDTGTGVTAGITNQSAGAQALIVTGFRSSQVVQIQNNGAATDNGTIGLSVQNPRGYAANLSGRVPLYLDPTGLSPRNGRPGPFAGGAMVADGDGDLWYCAGDGSPASFRKVSGPATAGQFHVLGASVRVYDSRPGNLPNTAPKSPITGAADRVVATQQGVVAGTTTPAVPAGASAVMLNLTVVNTSASGYLSVFKNGIPWPGTSTINWSAPNTVLANMAIVAVDAQARFAVRCATGATTDFLVDVIGYYL